MNVNVPLVAGGVAAVAGLTAGVIAERISHDNLESEKAGIESQRAAGQQWIDTANSHFGDEITADRHRSRDLDAKIEDYTLEHPKPSGVHYGRDAGWHDGVNLQGADRDGFWGLSLAGGALGGGLVGAFTLGLASESGLHRTGPKVAGAIGAALLAGGLGVAAGSIVSNWTH